MRSFLVLMMLYGCSVPASSIRPSPVEAPTERVGNAVLSLSLGPSTRKLSQAALRTWVRRSALLVTEYCGGAFPTRHLEVEIETTGYGLGWGQHWGGKKVMAMAGRRTTPKQLERDHVLLHEMLHVAFPSLPKQQRWMREGLSTYLETVVQVRAGLMSEEDVWKRWTNRMSYGLPSSTDRGYDHARSWGATYWGGALFWMRVDIELRKETQNRISIRDLVVGLLAEGGNAKRLWTVKQLLRASARITGTKVLARLYRSMARRPTKVDLPSLYESLGVNRVGGHIMFDDSAPLADIRKGMSARRRIALPSIPNRRVMRARSAAPAKKH